MAPLVSSIGSVGRSGVRSSSRAFGTSADEFYAPEHNSFDSFDFHPTILESLGSLGLKRPSRIQGVTFDAVSSGDDVIINAETGSGKTLSYLLPILDRLVRMEAPGSGAVTMTTPKAVVLVPTQELVLQVMDVVTSVCPEATEWAHVAYANKGPSRKDTVRLLIATPQALIENVRFKSLAEVETVVLDEADLMLSGAYDKSLRLELLPHFKNLASPAQHIFCAATIPDKGTKSVKKWLDRYYPVMKVFSTGAEHRVSARVEQVYVDIDESGVGRGAELEEDPASFAVPYEEADLVEEATWKPRLRWLLGSLLPVESGESPKPYDWLTEDESASVQPTIVFCNSLRSVLRVEAHLKEHAPHLAFAALHKKVSDMKRHSLISNFRDGVHQVLVCTDLASRGIDTTHVAHVVQAEFANDAVSFIHRVGRTGRVGTVGRVTNLVSRSNAALVAAIRHAEQEGLSLETVFSRRGSFKRERKKKSKGKKLN